MSLVSLERGVVAELDVHGALPQLRHAVGEVVDHGRRRRLVVHLQESLQKQFRVSATSTKLQENVMEICVRPSMVK